MPSSSRVLGSLLVIASSLTALPTSADEATAGEASGDEASAEAAAQYRHAKELFNDERYELALPLFREALARSDSPNARLFVARCLRETGDLVGAFEQFTLTLASARQLAESEPKYQPTRDAAAAEIARLEQRIGRVVVALPEAVPDARVTVGDRAVADPKQPTAVLPGAVTVAVEADGYATVTRDVEVGAGALETVVIDLEPTDGAPDGGTLAPPPSSADAEGGGLGTWRTVGIVVASVGVGGLVMGGVTGAMARSKESQLEEECGGQRCSDASHAEVVDSGKTMALLANVGFFAGGGLVAAGVAMIIFGGPDDGAEASARLSPQLVVTPNGAWTGLGGSF